MVLRQEALELRLGAGIQTLVVPERIVGVEGDNVKA
jgi:hypothetical protein